jgi:uncharacterized protein involved in exopolysaccharide biosynthesis
MPDTSSILSAIYSRRLTILLVWLSSIASAKILIPASAPTVSLKTEAGNIPSGPIIPSQEEELRVGIIGIARSGAVYDRVAVALPGVDPKTLRANVIGDIGRDSFLQILSYGKTPEESAMLANAFSAAFQDEMQSLLESGPRRTLESFQRREPLAWQEFSKYSTELVDYLGGVGFNDIEVEAGSMLEHRQLVQQQIEALELLHKSNLSQRPVYEDLLSRRPEFIVTSQSLSENSAYKAAVEESNKLATELALKKLEYKNQHPEILRLSNELALVQARVSQQAELTHSSSTMAQDPQALSFMQKMIEIDIAESSYNAQWAVFEDSAQELDSLLKGVPLYRSEVARITAQINQARNHAEDVSARRAELEFHLEHGIRFTMSDEYSQAVPEKAVAIPTPLGIIIFSVLVGLVAGLLVAIISELIKQMRLHSPY